LERGRADAPFAHQMIEALEVPFFLRRHPRDQFGFGAIAPQHGELPGVDPGRAIFAGLVDPQHRGAVGTAIAGAPAAHSFDPFSVRRVMTAAPLSEMIAFQPAIERPRNDHWIWSQRISGAPTICLSSSSVVAAWAVDVQVVKPSKILSSTPA